MSQGREQRLADMRRVARAFGNDARHLVFVGGALLGVYARPECSTLRPTKDVDCLWMGGFAEQQVALARLGYVLIPDKELLCRYKLKGIDLAVDVLDLNGHNVGGRTRSRHKRGICRAPAPAHSCIIRMCSTAICPYQLFRLRCPYRARHPSSGLSPIALSSALERSGIG